MGIKKDPKNGGTDSIDQRPKFQALISGDIPPKYGQKYSTNVPPSILFLDVP